MRIRLRYGAGCAAICREYTARIREVSIMDFNKIKAMGLEYAEKGKNAAMDLAEKGMTQALLV